MDYKATYMPLVLKAASDMNISPKLLAAILTVESSWNSHAVRYEPTYTYLEKPDYYANLNNITVATETQLQKCSWGLGQVMGGVARELGFSGPLQSLCDPTLGIRWAALKIKKICAKYTHLEDQIAAYNAGTPRQVLGKYANQDYVDKVEKALTIA